MMSLTICKLCNRYNTQCTNVSGEDCSCPVVHEQAEQIKRALALCPYCTNQSDMRAVLQGEAVDYINPQGCNKMVCEQQAEQITALKAELADKQHVDGYFL